MKKLLLAMLMVSGVVQAYNGHSRIPTQDLIDMRNYKNEGIGNPELASFSPQEQQRERQEKIKYINQQKQKALNNLSSAAEQATLNWATTEEIHNYVQSGIQNAQMQQMEE